MFLVRMHLENPTAKSMAGLLEVLTEANESYLRAHPGTPALYQAGVRFQREAPGAEDWNDIAAVRKLGYGDCEDLSCWRAAELRRAGIHARPVLRSGGRKNLLHAVVLLPDGRIEDPSKKLGLKGRG